MAAKFKPVYLIKQTNSKHSGLVIFCHGSGDTGYGIKKWVEYVLNKDLTFPHLQVLYPTAPLRPYTLLNGGKSNVWFDRKEISFHVPELKESIDSCAQDMVKFIKSVAADIPLNRIIIGGFSMGGCLSLHLAYRFLPDIAGVFCLSSFLGKNSVVYDELKSANAEKNKNIPLLMCHGENDELVPIQWGESTYNNLTQQGIKAKFIPLKDTSHELITTEINELNEWILNILPPLPSDN